MLCISMYMYMCIIYIYTHTHTHTHAYTHTHTHKHKHTHKHTHTHIYRKRQRSTPKPSRQEAPTMLKTYFSPLFSPFFLRCFFVFIMQSAFKHKSSIPPLLIFLVLWGFWAFWDFWLFLQSASTFLLGDILTLKTQECSQRFTWCSKWIFFFKICYPTVLLYLFFLLFRDK